MPSPFQTSRDRRAASRRRLLPHALIAGASGLFVVGLALTVVVPPPGSVVAQAEQAAGPRPATSPNPTPNGQRLTIPSPLGEIGLDLDPIARRMEVQSAQGVRTSYGFDPWGQVTRLAVGDHAVTYAYDTLGNLLRAEDQAGAVRLRYDPDQNRVERELPNGVRTVYQADAGGRIASIEHRAAAGTLLCGFRYAYDPADRMVGVEESVGGGTVSLRYQYDAVGRLVAATRGDGEPVAYRYDPTGNRIAETRGGHQADYAYDDAARLVQAGETRFAYDAKGRLVERESPAGKTAFTWDTEGQLAEVRTPAHRIRYVYDGAGVRIRRELDGVATDYVTDRLAPVPQVIGERGPAGGADWLLAPARLGRRGADGRMTYLLDDRLGSTRCVVDAAGALVARYDYSPFGEPRLAEGDAQTDFLFAGEQWDAEAGLYFLRNRYYDPSIGRFLSQDPLPPTASLLRPQGLNLYAYAAGDPVNGVDPLGLQTCYTPGTCPWDVRYSTMPAFTSGFPDLRNGYTPPQVFPRYTPPPVVSSPIFPQSWVEPMRSVAQYSRPSPSSGSTDHSVDGIKPGVHGWTYYVSPSDLTVLTPSRDLDRYGRAAIVAGAVVVGLGAVSVSPVVAGTLALGAGALTVNDIAKDLMARNYRGLTTTVGLETAGRSVDWLRKHPTSWAPSGVVTGLGSALGAINLALELKDTRLITSFFGSDFPTTAYSVVDQPRTHVKENLPIATLITQCRGAGNAADCLMETEYTRLTPLDDQRKAPLFPPGGDGGAPTVGGVYLDQAARILGQLGEISGASFDPKTGELVLLAEDQSVTTEPLNPEYLGAALRAVYTDSQYAPGMTIDPLPQNPLGPEMKVIFFGNTGNTRLGFTMFEADRVMKGLSVGRDNMSKQPVDSAVPGYRSLTAMKLADAGGRTDLWSRFWLVPEPVTARVSEDGRTILFDPIRMRVRTETMRWEKGQLIPAGGERDTHAEAFAEHLTAHYDAFAAESPVFAELKQVTRAVALAQWLREQGVPLEANLLATLAGAPYPTPERTPSARNEVHTAAAGGETLGVAAFGGVDMSPRISATKDPAAGRLQEALVTAQAEAAHQARPDFRIESDGRRLHAVALPMAGKRLPGTYSLAVTDLADGLGEAIAGLPGLTRHYNSTHNAPGELGPGWSLLLPRLTFQTSGKPGEHQFMSVEGVAGTRVQVRRVTLTDDQGATTTRFGEPFVDQEQRRIGFAPVGDASPYRGLYPQGDDGFRLVWTAGGEARFDREGRLLALSRDGLEANYRYDRQHRLERIGIARGGRKTEVRFERDPQGRITAMRVGEHVARFGYDQDGRLADAKSATRTGYRYDDRHRLTEVEINGTLAVRNTYNPAGQVEAQEDGAGHRVEQRLDPEGTGTTLVQQEPDGAIERHLDTAGRLTRTTYPDGTIEERDYNPDGDLKALVWRTGETAATRAEIDRAHRALTLTAANGQRADLAYTAGGQLAEVKVGGERVLKLDYDAADRPTRVDYAGGAAETFQYDPQGRLIQYRRQASKAGAEDDGVAFRYDATGRISAVLHPATGTTSLRVKGQEIQIARGPGQTRATLDPAGRPVALNAADGLGARLRYDPDGTPAGIALRRGEATAELRFQEGRLVEVRTFDGGTTRYDYLPNGLPAAVVDAAASRFEYRYDAQDRLREVRLPDGRCTRMRYENERDQVGTLEVGPCRDGGQT